MANKDPPASAEDKARYDRVRDELAKMLMKKRAADRQLAQIELSIYNLETSYLTDTASTGNIIHGFDGYLKPTQGAAARRKHEIGMSTQPWSPSLTLSRAQSLDLVGDGEESTPAPDDFKHPTTPGVTTVVVPPAPRTQELTAAQQKKNRDREYQRRKRAMRRSAGTVSDEDAHSAGTGRRALKRARVAEDE
ncbi:histone acetyltransferase subunit NuA4-domain-containing protein [Boletus reticuloceps]|uniref:Chromatin modification-related protein EAF6 n=1 Tax=Boletus reticuloceps TaxID=495285 RepID=A0A8I2YRV3_9AGAM|nr:histone acetyltransferase subunit NuA4-domain-containing protein [Boletus reticuloceps]